MTGADEHNIAYTAGDELHSPQDEGVQKDVAEFTVRLHQRQQCFAIDFNQFARFRRPDAHQATASGKHCHFTSKHPQPTYSEEFFPIVSDSEDVQLSFDDHKEFRGLLIEID